MKIKVLMVYPEFPVTYWSLKHSMPFVMKKSAIIPLGLLTVAAMLPDEYDIRLIDMNVARLNKKDIIAADLVFISAMIVQQKSFDEVVKLCNESRVPVVAGGPYPTTSYEKIPGVDYFVLNEAEQTLHHFLKDYEAGCARHIYLDPHKPDITGTPAPRFDIIDITAYQNVALQNSRGCPYNCEFCDIIELFGRKPRYKNPDQFINEINIVFEKGFRGSLFIVDDNFIGNKKKVKDLLRKIIEWQKAHKHPFSLFTEASIDMSDDDELLDLMVEAGFDMVFVGIETPNAAALAECRKNQNLKVNLFEQVKKIQEAGIEVAGGFIVGFDNDTEDIFDRQIEFIQKAGIPMAMVGLLGALPNTALYRRLKSEGRLKQDVNWNGNNTHDLRMSFTPVMPEETLIRGYKKIISKIYSPKGYFERCLTCIDHLSSPRKKQKTPVTILDIYSFFLSLIKQTFSKYGYYYLSFLWKVIIHKGSFLHLAVSLSVKGYHFFKMTDDIIKADDYSILLGKAKSVFQEKQK
ncbi:MAG: B12-binding domain-containing radical SAM protein, partial [Spirochaetes bacterium]|nr:B12-binding domain-containing radical SAM protein [Spirochaetota bacterium]